jgi:hypothetical protein
LKVPTDGEVKFERFDVVFHFGGGRQHGTSSSEEDVGEMDRESDECKQHPDAESDSATRTDDAIHQCKKKYN